MGLELRIDMNRLPIENCYWVVPGKLLAGEYPRDREEESSRVKINALLSAGIKSFIDLTEEDEGIPSAISNKGYFDTFLVRFYEICSRCH